MSATPTKPAPTRTENPTQAPPPAQTGLRVFDPSSVGLPSAPVTDPTIATTAITAARANRCHILGPLTIGNIPDQHEVAFRVVTFDENDWYSPESGKYALLKHALDRLLAAAGGSTDPAYCMRVDDRSRDYLWEYQAGVRVPAFDGSVRPIVRTRVLDLRDGSAEAEQAMGAAEFKGEKIPDWKRQKKLQDKRVTGPAMCETKAMNRAIRAALGLKSAYTEAERFRPFVCPVLVSRPDLTNPVIAEMYAAKHLGLVDQLYGPGSARRPALASREAVEPTRREIVDTPIDVVEDAPAPVQVAAPARAEAPARASKPARLPAHPDDATPRRTTHAAEVVDVPHEDHCPGFSCSECGCDIDEKLAGFTDEQYGRMLCREHLVEAGS